jgi:hypothetical protein
MAVAKKLKGHITTPEIEVAIAEMFDLRKNIIVPNIQAGMQLHECDVLMYRPTGYGVEFEIKLTKSDLMKDFSKDHHHESELIKEVYYAVPANIVSVCLQVLPKTFGIIVARRGADMEIVTEIVRPSIENADARKWTAEEAFKLAKLGNMRWPKLKRELNTLRRKTGN